MLNQDFQRCDLIDWYESMIWTERWNDYGDFEMEIQSTPHSRSLFPVGRLLAINNSYRVMQVETAEDHIDETGKNMLHIQGRSLEAILDDRVVMWSLASPKWNVLGKPTSVANQMFDRIVRNASINANDTIPFLQPGTLLPSGSFVDGNDEILWEQEPDSLYRALQSLCKVYDLGFRLVRNFDQSELYFEVYTGSDRTTGQTIREPVVFAVNMDNIQNTRELVTIEKSKNVAYVVSEHGNRVVYAPGVSSSVSGLDRRVMVIKSNVQADNPNIQSALLVEGRKALRRQSPKSLFDGEVDQRTSYVYGVDYEVGDLIEMRNRDGDAVYYRVSEQVFVADGEGERAYPTMMINERPL